MHAHACKQYIYIFPGPITNLLSVRCVLMSIFSRVTQKRKENCFRIWSFILLLVVLKWQNGSERVKCERITFLHLTVQTADAQWLPVLVDSLSRFNCMAILTHDLFEIRFGRSPNIRLKRLVYQRVSRHLGCMQSIHGRYPQIDPLRGNAANFSCETSCG